MLSPDPRPPDASRQPLSGGKDAAIDWTEVREQAFRRGLCICGRHDLAEEVAQETAFRILRVNKPIRDLAALVNTTAYHASLSLLRRQRSRCDHVSPDSPTAELAASAQVDPVDRLMAKQLLAELDSRFGPRTRAILELRVMGRFRWKQIEELVGLSDRTCRIRHEKAMLWINDQLNPVASKESTHE